MDTDIRYVEYCRIHVFKRKGVDEMKDVVLDEVMKELNFIERIIIKIFGNLFYYAYRKGMIDCFKYYNK